MDRRRIGPPRSGRHAQDADPRPAQNEQRELNHAHRRPARHGLAGKSGNRRAQQPASGPKIEKKERGVRTKGNRRTHRQGGRRQPPVERVHPPIARPEHERSSEQGRGEEGRVDSEQVVQEKRLGSQADDGGEDDDAQGGSSGHASSRSWAPARRTLRIGARLLHGDGPAPTAVAHPGRVRHGTMAA